MCGACGERGATDWARPWVAGPAARTAVARAVTQLRLSPGTRISTSAGGWLVVRPTGGSVVCGTLGELVAAAPCDPVEAVRPSGRLTVPAADGRTGVILRIDPLAPPRDLDAVRPGSTHVVVPDEATALTVLADLATPPWQRRLYLERIEGADAERGRPLGIPDKPPDKPPGGSSGESSGRWLDASGGSPGGSPGGSLDASGGSPGGSLDASGGSSGGWLDASGGPSRFLGGAVLPPLYAEFAADLVVRLEWARQAGQFDDAAFALRCLLGDTADAPRLDVEIRAGHVVRARTHR